MNERNEFQTSPTRTPAVREQFLQLCSHVDIGNNGILQRQRATPCLLQAGLEGGG